MYQCSCLIFIEDRKIKYTSALNNSKQPEHHNILVIVSGLALYQLLKDEIDKCVVLMFLPACI